MLGTPSGPLLVGGLKFLNYGAVHCVAPQHRLPCHLGFTHSVDNNVKATVTVAQVGSLASFPELTLSSTPLVHHQCIIQFSSTHHSPAPPLFTTHPHLIIAKGLELLRDSSLHWILHPEFLHEEVHFVCNLERIIWLVISLFIVAFCK